MTDAELLSRVFGLLDPGAAGMHGLRRGGRLLLALPKTGEAAARALRLYQPQRRLARWMVAVLHGLARASLQGCLLPKLHLAGEPVTLDPPLPGIEPGTCGVLLGSPEHRVRRAIASFRNAGQWEVAKISFGKDGARVLEREAQVLKELQPLTKGVPRLLGLHRAADVTVLRMPYLTGTPVSPGESAGALRLLHHWITDGVPQPATAFPEWGAIESALSGDEAGTRVLGKISQLQLKPVICHGDFARWNLLQQADGELIVLDWEWGHAPGMPGIDLIHYFLQDARLVRRLTATAAIASTLRDLNQPACRGYLNETGWTGDLLLAIIACLAYKQGAGHQENGEVLRAAVAAVFPRSDSLNSR